MKWKLHKALASVLVGIAVLPISPAKFAALTTYTAIVNPIQTIPIAIERDGRFFANVNNPNLKCPVTDNLIVGWESGGVNISKPDSDGLISDGIGQFHRGKGDLISTGTWGTWEKESGIPGSPIVPSDAIEMMDWAISNGLVGAWSTSHPLNDGNLKKIKASVEKSIQSESNCHPEINASPASI